MAAVVCRRHIDGPFCGGPLQLDPFALLLEENSHFILERLPEEAVDERVQAAVREGRQPDSVTRQRVFLPERVPACVPSQQVDAYEGVLREPAEEED